jgi:surface protein
MSYLSPPMSLTVNLTSGSNLTVTLPIFDISGTFQVDWSNNTVTTYTSLPVSQTYASTGTYTIKISVLDNGSYIRRFGSNGWVGSAYLTAINDWGNLNGLTTFNYIGGSLINFSVPSTIPASVTSLQNMFNGASAFNQPIGSWDVGGVQDMLGMFQSAPRFNADISGWNVSNVTTMRAMFSGATDFNKNLSKWNVSNKLTSMRLMVQLSGFTSNLSRWNVSNVNDFYDLFYFTSGYTPLIYSLVVIGWSSLPSLLTANPPTVNISLSGTINLFDFAIPAYNLLRNTYKWSIFISGTAAQTFIAYTGNAMIFSLNFNTVGSSVTLPFSGGTSPTFSVDWGDSTTSNNLLTHTYDGSGTYIIQFTPLTNSFTTFGSSSWATANYVTAIHTWGNITGLTTLNYIGGAALTTVPTTLPATVTNMSNMFASTTIFNGNLSRWNVSQVTNMTTFFLDNSPSMSPLNWSLAMIGWNSLPSLASLGANVFTIASIYDFASPAYTNLKTTRSWNLGLTATVPYTGRAMIFSVKLNTVGTAVTLPFTGVTGSTYSVDWGDARVDTNSLTHTYDGSGTYIIQVDPSNTTMTTFGSSSWATANYITGIHAWGNIPGLTTLNNIGGAALTTVPTTLPATVTNLRNMFTGASTFNQAISTWDVSGVQDMSGMFQSASAFNKEISDWNIKSVTTMANMFTGATAFSSVNYSALLFTWAALPVKQTGVPLGFNATNVIYDYALPAYTTLRDTNGWDITPSQTSPISTPTPMALTLTGLPASTITLPLLDMSGTYVVDWSDNAITTHTSAEPSHDYSSGGNYSIRIRVLPDGSFIRTFGSTSAWSGSANLNSITDWGNFNGITKLTNIGGAALTSVPTTLPVTVTSLINMFTGASTFNQAISTWDVSGVQDMSGMFQSASAFNKDISDWNIKSVTTMTNMFTGAAAFSAFNYSALLTKWVVLPVKQNGVPLGLNAANVIYDYALPAYNRLQSEFTWNITPLQTSPISTPTPMALTLTSLPASTITLPLLDISGTYVVDWSDNAITTHTSASPSHVYVGAGNYTIHIRVLPDGSFISTFGGPAWSGSAYLTSITDWGNFNGITKLTNIGGAALTTVPTTLPATVTILSNMFNGAITFNQAISTWDVSGVQDMSGLFQSASAFNQDLSHWNIKSVTTMQNMFTGATAFSTLNYSSLLIAWAALPSIESDVYLDFNSNAAINSNALPAFLKLTSTPINWKITPDFTPPPPPPPAPPAPFYGMVQSLYSDNSLVYYKPHSLSASIGSTVRNSRAVAKRT